MGIGSAPYSEGFPFSYPPFNFFFFLCCCDHFDLAPGSLFRHLSFPTLGTWLLGCGGTLVFKLPSSIGRDGKRLSPCRCTHSASASRSTLWLTSWHPFFFFFSVHLFLSSSSNIPHLNLAAATNVFCPFTEWQSDRIQRVYFAETAGEVIDAGVHAFGLLQSSGNRLLSFMHLSSRSPTSSLCGIKKKLLSISEHVKV